MTQEHQPHRERRIHPRVQALYLVSYVTDTGDLQKKSAEIGRTLDISSAGIRLEVYERIAPNSDVEVEIAIGEMMFSTRGKFVYARETDCGIFIAGIEFTQRHPELVAMIDNAAKP